MTQRYLLKCTLLCLLILSVSAVQGQRKTWNLGVFADPSDQYRVKINGELMDPGYAFNVDPGRIHLELWSPNHEVFDTTFVYHTGKITIFKKLKPNPELLEYRLALAERQQILRSIYLSFSAAAVTVVGAGVNYNRIGDRNYDFKTNEYGNRYNLPGYTNETEEEARTRLRKARTFQYALYGVAAGLTAYGIYKIFKINEMEIEKPGKDRSFYVDDLGFMPVPGGGAQGMLRVKF